MTKPIAVKTKDLEKILSISYAAAHALKHKIRDFFDKEDHQVLTPQNVAQYLDVPESEIIDKLTSKQ